jgi:hypothetical protein
MEEGEDMKSNQLQLIALAAVVAFAACAQTDDDADVPADSVAIGADSVANAPPTEPVVTNLDDVDDSGISGEATATHSASDVTVSILLKDGAKSDVTYAAHIHTGTCERGGPVAVELEPVKNLQSTKTIPVSSLPANQDAFVQVHAPGGKAVACGDMKGHDSHDGAAPTTTTTH